MTPKKYPSPRPIAVDLFCGAGGMSLGFEQAGFDIALGVDADGHHVATHERNFPQGKAACVSVVGLDAKRIHELGGIDGEIALIFGGPPCQGFSNMGHRDKDDPRNTLVDEFARVVIDVRPKAFVMENVPAMGAGDTRRILDRVISDLEAGGYKITKPIQKLVASDFGVPQHRIRLFVLGIRSDVGQPISYPGGPVKGQPEQPTVFEAIADLPAVDRYEQLFKTDCVAYDQPPMTRYSRVARGLEDDPSDLSIPREWDRTSCSGCLRTRHAPASIELYSATPPGGVVPGHKLPRLDPNGLAPTLRAGSDSTRGSYTAPRPIHPFLPRCITAREAARLHGYPDWFAFFPTKWHAYKQIGNSVCPPVSRAIGYQVLKALRMRRTIKLPDAIRLTNKFALPEDRPRQHRRIPQLREYPPVISALFRRAFDEKAQALTRPKFSFEDVQAAIAGAKATMHWTRRDTFLDEIARSRNVRQILAEPLARGFSIMPLSDPKWMGEFVPVSTSGCIDQKEEMGAKARDLSSAVQIKKPAELLRNLGANVWVLLNDYDVRTRLWPESVKRIDTATDLLPFAECTVFSLSVVKEGGRIERSCALIGSSSNVPTASRIVRTCRVQSTTELIALTQITAKHILVSRFKCRTERATEVNRHVFALNGHH